MAVMLDAPAGPAAAIGELTYSFPIQKFARDEDGDLVVSGVATDGSIDSDNQIAEVGWTADALASWKATGANVRMAHDPRRPIGKGLRLEIDRDGDGKHWVHSVVVDRDAQRLIEKGVLTAYSIGIMNPVIKRDPTGRASGGIICGGEIGELSIVDRPANPSAYLQVAKSAGNGAFELTGTLTAPKSVLAKVAAPRSYKSVSVDMPAGMKIKFSPAQLAKMNTIAAQNAVAAAQVTKAAEPDAEKAAADVLPGLRPAMLADEAARAAGYDGAVDTLAVFKAAGVAEDAVLGKKARTFTAEQRREHAAAGNALPDGSYPIPDKDALRRAAILARSKHGNWKAAARLIARRARELGVPNPMKKKPKAGKPAVTETVVADVAKCACSGTGLADGKPCLGCEKGAAAADALLAKATAILPEPEPAVTKKQKVMCGHCGAKQSAKHEYCSECGQSLHSALPVNKNHDYDCLNCGREDLDKGERFCPGCGAENPGYLPEADHKIPANKAARERVDSNGAVKGMKPGKKDGKKGKKDPFGGKKAMPFGKDKNGDQDADDEKGTAKAGQPAVAKRKGGKGKKPKDGYGRSPATGSVPQMTHGLPPHREPDGAPVEAFEHDAGIMDDDMEVKAALRHKAACPDPVLASVHDLTCPAFHPADVAKAVPWASWAMIDESAWQGKALEAASGGDVATAMARWNEMAGLGRAAQVLKGTDPQVLMDLGVEHHAMFREVNKTRAVAASPGPARFPTPAMHMPGEFKRPYITAGHASPSPFHGPPHTFAIPGAPPVARDFGHGYLTAGHAMDSPANDTPRHEPIPAPEVAGRPQRVFYQNAMRDNARAAMMTMHDHISHLFPDICPMSPHVGDGQKPAPDVPQAVGGPVPHRAGKAAGAGTTKAARAAEKARLAKKAAKAQGRKAAAMRDKVQRQILKGDLTVDEGRAKLGLKPFAVPEAQAPLAAAPPAGAPDPAADALKAATAPLLKRLAKQDKALRKQQRYLEAIAGQSDTTSAPYRGAGGVKTVTIPQAPAGPANPAEAAAQAQAHKMQRLWHEFRTTPIPEHQEAAWQELNAMLGTNPMTGNNNDMVPFQPTYPQTRA